MGYLYTRTRHPSYYTHEEWQQITDKADAEGKKCVAEYPGTFYDKEALVWDFSGNQLAMEKFAPYLPGLKMSLLVLADISHKAKEEVNESTYL